MTVVVLAVFDTEVAPKGCSLGYQMTLREVFKGPANFVKDSVKNVYLLAVLDCGIQSFRPGEALLVSGNLDDDGDLNASIIHGCDKYVPQLELINMACN